MFRNLKEKLITNFPLAWNMRLYIFLPLALLINLLYYLTGFFEDIEPGSSNKYVFYFPAEMLPFSVLLTSLILIFWLSAYLKNNAFKSFYPLKKGFLFSEFLIILLIIFSSSFFPYSYKIGVSHKIRYNVSKIDVKEEAEIANLAMHFLPVDLHLFGRSDQCDTARREDSAPYNDPGPSAAQPEELQIIYRFSNYCHEWIRFDNKENRPAALARKQRANRWIREKQTDSIEWVIREMITLCEKYGGVAQLDVKAQVHDCLDDTINRLIGQGPGDMTPADDYIEIYPISGSLNFADRAKRMGVWPEDWDEFIFFIYYVLASSLLLFAFRITSVRTWARALISLGILAIIFGLMLAIRLPLDFVFWIYIILPLIALFHTWSSVSYSQNQKKTSGVALLWFSWLLPSIPLSLAAWLFEKTEGDHSHYAEGIRTGHDSVPEWIDRNWDLIHSGTIIMTILVMAFVIIPLARKWQACPEE